QVEGRDLEASELATALYDPSRRSNAVMIASTEVANTGSPPGEENVELYVRLMGTSVAQPVRALKGFQHVTLAPGETRKVTFALSPETLALWNDRNEWTVEPAKVAVWISPDSARGSPAVFQLLP